MKVVYIISILVALISQCHANIVVNTDMVPSSNWIGGGCYGITMWNQNENPITLWHIDVSFNHNLFDIIPTIDEVWPYNIFARNSYVYANTLIISSTTGNGNIDGWGRLIGVGLCVSYSPEVNGNEIVINYTTSFNENAHVTFEPMTMTTTTTTTTFQVTIPLTSISAIAPYTIASPDNGTYWLGDVKLDIVAEWKGGLCINLELHNTASTFANSWIFKATRFVGTSLFALCYAS